jgi:hypothetical protein
MSSYRSFYKQTYGTEDPIILKNDRVLLGDTVVYALILTIPNTEVFFTIINNFLYDLIWNEDMLLYVIDDSHPVIRDTSSFITDRAYHSDDVFSLETDIYNLFKAREPRHSLDYPDYIIDDDIKFEFNSNALSPEDYRVRENEISSRMSPIIGRIKDLEIREKKFKR